MDVSYVFFVFLSLSRAIPQDSCWPPAGFRPLNTPKPLMQCEKSLDRLEKAAKEDAKAEAGTCKVSPTTELVWSADAGPGARTARPTHIPTAFLALFNNHRIWCIWCGCCGCLV
jgi:hypothetical protein